MAFLEWQTDFGVGVDEFDRHHKQLIALINRLHDAMLEGAPPVMVGEILTELVQYTKFHFSREEEAMRKHGYSDFLEHKRQHEKLADQVFEFAEQFKAGKTTLSIGLMNFLKQWLKEHILKTDRQYAAHFQGCGVR